MIVASYVTNKSNLNDTRTYEDYYKYLGARPQRLGVMSRMYPWLTASFLTEGLANIYELDIKKEKFKSLEAPYVEWDVDNGQYGCY